MTANFTSIKSQIRTIKRDDPRFRIVDKFTTCDRAGLEITKQCPYNYAQIIADCIDRGWVQPVAYVTERELLFMGLNNE
jgi:hypothetical protein